MKIASTFAVGTALALVASTAGAQDTVQACIDAHAQGQREEQAGSLLSAEKRYLTCSERSCPSIVQKDCTGFLERVRTAMPRFNVRATDAESGRETAKVRVRVDGAVIEESLSGRPIPVDPGEHAIEVEFPDRGVQSTRAVFRQGEPVRVLSFTAPSRETKSAPKGSAPASRGPRGGILAPVFGGLALVGLGSFAFFGIRGLGRESDLETTCGPPCTRDDLAPLRRDYLVADVSLGVGIVSAAVATWLFLRDSPSKRSDAAWTATLPEHRW